MTVVIPVFDRDLAFVFGKCRSGRLELAQAAFPDIDKWLLVGHSFGGVAAMTDVWVEITQMDNDSNNSNDIAGLVMLASDVQPLLCPGSFIDFSAATNTTTDLPMAAVTASEDQILNTTRWEENKQYLSSTTTTFVVIEGGNHGQFGDYNDTLRTPLLGQVDGEATISKYTQWDLTVDAIMNVAYQSGLDLPRFVSDIENDNVSSSSSTMAPTFDRSSAACSKLGSATQMMPWFVLAVSFLWAWRK